MRSSAKTARAKARWAKFSRAFTRRMRAKSTWTASPSARTRRWPRARLGIAMVHQELAFCPNLTVAENLCLGDLPRRAGWLDRRQHARTSPRDACGNRDGNRRGCAHQPALHRPGAAHPDRRRAWHAGPDHRHGRADQFAFGQGKRESVSTCSPNSSSAASRSFTCRIAWRKSSGCATASPCCAMAATSPPNASRTPIPSASSSKWSGAKSSNTPRNICSGPWAKKCCAWKIFRSPGKFSNVSFTLRAGEILGFAGLVGAGRSEVAQAIFGLDDAATGKVFVRGTELPLHIGERRACRWHWSVA